MRGRHAGMAQVKSDAISNTERASAAMSSKPTASQLAPDLVTQQSSFREIPLSVPELPDLGSVLENPALSESELYNAFALANAATCAVAATNPVARP